MLRNQTSVIFALSLFVLTLAMVVFLGGEVEPEGDETELTLVDIEPEEVLEIRIQRREDQLEFVREESEWRMQVPVEDRADDQLLSRIVKALEGAKRGIRLDNADPGAMGFEPEPIADVELVVDGGAVVAFQVGDRAPVGWQDYLRNDQGAIYAVSGNLSGELTRRSDQYRHPGLIEIDFAEVTEVRLRSAPGLLDVRKGADGRWWLEGFGAANPDAVEELLIALSTMRFTGFYHAALPSIDSPAFEVEVVQGAKSFKLTMGDVTAMGRLAVDTEGRPGFVDAAASVFLRQGPTDLGITQVLDARPSELTAVTIRGSNSTREYRHDGVEWSLANESELDVDMDACLATLEESSLVYRLTPPAVDGEALTQIEISGDDFSRGLRFHPVDSEFVAMSDTAGGGPLRVARETYTTMVSACGLRGQ